MPEPSALRRLIGEVVCVRCLDGEHRGRLLNVTRTSLWLVDDEDCDDFVPLTAVAELRPAA